MTDLPAAIYARQSLDKTGQGLAVTRQLDECRATAARRGWKIISEYVDNDISVTAGRPRPEYARLLDDVRSGQVRATSTP